jgi:branched-chain amino acid transport system permease protein
MTAITLAVDAGQLAGVAVDAVAFGAFLALLGVGITLVFGLGEVLNLAVGTFAVAAVLAAVGLLEAGLGLAPAIAGGVLAVALLGVAVDRTLLSLVYRSEGDERVLLGIFVTLGLAIALDGLLLGPFPGSYSLPVEFGVVRVGPAALATASLVTIAVAAVVLGALVLFLRRTYLGRAARTVFQDETGAVLVGVEPRRVRSLVFVLSAAVAGIAGLAYAAGATVGVASGFEFTVLALIVSVVGGVRSVPGAAVAGLLLGVVVQFASFLVGTFLAEMLLFVVAVAALLARPEVLG